MFFPSDRVLQACSGKLDDPTHFADVYDMLLQGRLAPRDYPGHLKAFLEELPGAEEQAKILHRFTGIAERYGYSIGNFRWWEIVPNERVLFATLQRDGHAITTVFWWKDTIKGERRISMNNANPMWIPDVEEPGYWRVQFEAATYQEVKAHFEKWLSKPLELPVRWAA